MRREPNITDTGDQYNFIFGSYLTYQDFFDAGQEAIAKARADGYSVYSGSDRMNLSVAQANAGEYGKYIDQNALNSAMEGFDSVYQTIDMGGALEKERIKFTENPRGIFDFSLASSGLFKVQEFFNEQLAKDNPFEFPNELPGIVPPDYVDLNQMGDYWYKSQDLDKKYQMTKQDKGQRGIDLDLPGAKYEYRTANKKVYMEFPKKGGKTKKVDLYIPISAAGGVNASGMLTRVLPMIIAAKYFESAGIRTRISSIRLYKSNSSVVGISWGIKDYGSDLDFNRIAIQSSDPRFFRWNMWRFVDAMQYVNNWPIRYAGTPMDYGPLMLSSQNRYKNWYHEQVEIGNLPDLGIHRNLQIFSALSSTPYSWEFNPNTYQNDTVYKEVVRQFHRILDIVDCQFNKPHKFVTRINKRLTDEYIEANKSIKGASSVLTKDDRRRIKDEVRNYCTRILAEAFSYAKNGMYKAPQDFRKENDAEFAEKIKGVTDTLNSM